MVNAPVAGLEEARVSLEKLSDVGSSSRHPLKAPSINPSGWMPQSRSKEDPGSMRDEDAPQLVGVDLADFPDPGRRIDEQVGVAVEHLAHVCRVFRVVAKMDADEGGVGVRAHQVFELGIKLVPGWKSRAMERPVRVLLQLAPALVGWGCGLEECLGISGVNGHRKAQRSRFLEDGCKARVVDVDALTRRRILDGEAEALEHLETSSLQLSCLGEA